MLNIPYGRWAGACLETPLHSSCTNPMVVTYLGRSNMQEPSRTPSYAEKQAGFNVALASKSLETLKTSCTPTAADLQDFLAPDLNQLVVGCILSGLGFPKLRGGGGGGGAFSVCWNPSLHYLRQDFVASAPLASRVSGHFGLFGCYLPGRRATGDTN